GDVRDFRNFMGAVIDKKAFTKISEYLDDAKKNAKVIQGGTARGDKGYFIDPTLIETQDPGYRLLCEEIFGPVLTAYVYPDGQWEETLDIVDKTSPYALTGAVFSSDRGAVRPPRARRVCSRAPPARSARPRRRCATLPATSTSTTSRPAQSSGSSPSAARADRAPTTRRDRS